MRTELAQSNFLLLNDDGTINYPFSKFLTERFDNPHTRELVSQSLRILARFLTANRIELAVRAVEGRCLTYQECSQLSGLCFRPIPEIDLLSDRKIVLITSAKSGKAPRDMRNAVEPNTVGKRLRHIAAYLKYYREAILDGHIRSSITRAELDNNYARAQEHLTSEVRGTKQNHHLTIQSLPSSRFQQVIREVVVRPETLFITAKAAVSSTLYRDRAMTLLACECLRPGAIANVAREDFRPEGGYLNVKDHRKKRQGRPTTGTPVLKLGQSTSVNSASETMISLYPFTVRAINDYIKNEREPILSKRLQNRSKGFLFLNQSGEPIKHRASLTAMFNRLGKRLQARGLLDVGNDPHFHNKRQYDFYAYVLRHSAASLFLEKKGVTDDVLSSMRTRFGWTAESDMPNLYAARALSDKANMDMMAFNQSLMDELHALGKGA